MKTKPPLPGQRWHKRRDLRDASFNIGDRHEFAMEMFRGRSWWYWTPDQKSFYGPFRTKDRARQFGDLQEKA